MGAAFSLSEAEQNIAQLKRCKPNTILVSDRSFLYLRMATEHEKAKYACMRVARDVEKSSMDRWGLEDEDEDYYHGWLQAGYGIGRDKPRYDRRVRMMSVVGDEIFGGRSPDEVAN